MKRRFVCFLFAAILLAGCSMYQSDWQCKPGNGIGCTPAGEVLELIVEREAGEDLFVKSREEAYFKTTEEAKKAESGKKKKKGPAKKLVVVKDEEGKLVLIPEKDEQPYRS